MLGLSAPRDELTQCFPAWAAGGVGFREGDEFWGGGFEVVGFVGSTLRLTGRGFGCVGCWKLLMQRCGGSRHKLSLPHNT